MKRFSLSSDATLHLLELRRNFFFLQYSLVVNHTAAHAILNNHTKSLESYHALTDYAKIATPQFFSKRLENWKIESYILANTSILLKIKTFEQLTANSVFTEIY